MVDSKEKLEENNPDSEGLLDELILRWPVKFYVCKKHKIEYFLEYENAILDETKPCELCNPKENDSLGG